MYRVLEQTYVDARVQGVHYPEARARLECSSKSLKIQKNTKKYRKTLKIQKNTENQQKKH